MSRRVVSVWAVAVWLFLQAGGADARADIVTLQSLAWMVSSSDYVIDGQVTRRHPVPGRSGEFFVTLETSRVPLKGTTGPWFTARVRGALPSVGQRVIVFATNRLTPSTCGRNPKTGQTLTAPHIFPR